MISQLNKTEPVSKITPVLPVVTLIDAVHALNDRSQTADGEFKPTFIFAADTAAPTDSDSPVLSKAGQLISQSFSQVNQYALYHAAEIKRNVQRDQSLNVLTTHPENSQRVMHDLKQAISNSGLFYESHLADYVEGRRTPDSLLEEPQNKANFDASTLLVKQLDILEQNKIQWGGQVWAGQYLDWEIRKENNLHSQPDGGRQTTAGEPDQSAVISTLTLDLANLGRVVTTLKIQDGQLTIHIQSAAASTTMLLKDQLASLAGALQKTGQPLDALIVEQHV